MSIETDLKLLVAYYARLMLLRENILALLIEIHY